MMTKYRLELTLGLMGAVLMLLVACSGSGSGSDSGSNPSSGGEEQAGVPQSPIWDGGFLSPANVPTNPCLAEHEPLFVTSADSPQLQLNGMHVVHHAPGTVYVDQGATASDPEDGDISASVMVVGLDNLDVNSPGDYLLEYHVSDSDGNQAVPVSRIVRVNQDELSRLSFRPTSQTSAALAYSEHLPLNYGDDVTARYPVIIHQHGYGHSADKNFPIEGFANLSINRVILSNSWDESLPFIVLMPQRRIASQQSWPPYEDCVLRHFIDYALTVYRIDPRRIYMMGFSSGAYATWEYLRAFPDRVAAAVPVAGGGVDSQVCGYSEVAVWAFIGTLDNPGSIDNIRVTGAMPRALNMCDPPPPEPARFTTFIGLRHEVIPILNLSLLNAPIVPGQQPYDESIYEWLLRHERD